MAAGDFHTPVFRVRRFDAYTLLQIVMNWLDAQFASNNAELDMMQLTTDLNYDGSPLPIWIKLHRLLYLIFHLVDSL